MNIETNNDSPDKNTQWADKKETLAEFLQLWAIQLHDQLQQDRDNQGCLDRLSCGRGQKKISSHQNTVYTRWICLEQWTTESKGAWIQ